MLNLLLSAAIRRYENIPFPLISESDKALEVLVRLRCLDLSSPRWRYHFFDYMPTSITPSRYAKILISLSTSLPKLGGSGRRKRKPEPWKSNSELWEARSRMYPRRFSQSNIHWNKDLTLESSWRYPLYLHVHPFALPQSQNNNTLSSCLKAFSILEIKHFTFFKWWPGFSATYIDLT